MEYEDAHRLVAEHLSEAHANNPGGNDVQLADYILRLCSGLDLRDPARGEAVLMLADEVRKRRRTIS